MKNYILISLVAFLITSCSEYKYPENEKLSERKGALIDSTASYLLQEIDFNGKTYSSAWNKDLLAQLDGNFKLISEPVLYNYYLERDIYRMVLSEKDKAMLVISVNKIKDKSWVVSKRIAFDSTLQNDSIPKSNFQLLDSNVRNYTRELDAAEIQALDSLLQAADFYHLPIGDVEKEHDNYCLIEGHEKGKYWMVYRPEGDESIKSLSTYIRSLTGF